MKFNRNLKVEYRSQSLLIPSKKRYLLFRIVPSELPLWKRLFCNGWKYAYNGIYEHKNRASDINDLLSKLFSYDEALKFMNTYKTFGELADYLNDVYAKAKKHYDEITPYDNRWNF